MRTALDCPPQRIASFLSIARGASCHVEAPNVGGATAPTNEAAVLGLTGQLIAPLAKGKGVRITAGEEGFSLTPLG